MIGYLERKVRQLEALAAGLTKRVADLEGERDALTEEIRVHVEATSELRGRVAALQASLRDVEASHVRFGPTSHPAGGGNGASAKGKGKGK